MARAVLVVTRHAGQPNRLDAYREALNRRLTGDNVASGLFPALVRARCCAALRAALRAAPEAPAGRHDAPRLGRIVPHRLRDAVSHWRARRPRLSPVVLPFRAFVATRMHSLLSADAATPPAGLEPVVNA